MQSTIYQPGSTEQHSILQFLGLQQQQLIEIGNRALAGYTSTTQHDAAGAAGQYAYLAAVRASRDVLCPLGWTPYKKKNNNIEFVALPSKNLLLFVSSGDKNTGIADADSEPKTKNPKGNQTQKLVNNNAKQMAFPFLAEAEKQIAVSETAPAWILLYRISPEDGLMLMELSLPVAFDPTKFCVDGWKQRVVLTPIEFSPTPTLPQQNFADNFEVEIKRKHNE